MFNVFKTKKNSIKEAEAIIEVPEAIIQATEVNYMSAEEALKLASQKWSILPTEKIFEKIQTYANKGYRDAHFSRAYISGEQRLTLEELGYKVEIYASDSDNPFFIVSW